ncbi:hypothetical protein AB0B25_32095 [Nocardia sp. NPDC049190]|uniref:hypothetical protein n=1 Tax=Nocardia sp. NPDC049190 TaxID=3155650 RepID=UPI00340CD353
MGKMFFNILATFAEVEVRPAANAHLRGHGHRARQGRLRGRQPKLSVKQRSTSSPSARRMKNTNTPQTPYHTLAQRILDLRATNGKFATVKKEAEIGPDPILLSSISTVRIKGTR